MPFKCLVIITIDHTIDRMGELSIMVVPSMKEHSSVTIIKLLAIMRGSDVL
jgi:hypothetical protein